MKLEIDLSAMKDTAGLFNVSGSTGLPYIIKSNNKIYVKYAMNSPGRASLLFYPRDSIKKHPFTSLGDIVVDSENLFDFFAQPGTFKILIKNDVAHSEIINPTQYQVDYADLQKKSNESYINLRLETVELWKQINAASDNKVKDSLKAVYSRKAITADQKYYNDVVFSYIKQNPDSPVALQEIWDYSWSEVADFNTMAYLYNILTDRLKTSSTGKFIHNQIDNIQFGQSLIGKNAPDFTIKDVNGKDITLSQYKGRITLLEFWASWCGTCRAFNPELVTTYQKYKDKNFEILGISLDLEKDSWLKAIAHDNLKWVNTSELASFNGSVSKLYHIYAIPNNYLIDKDGKVLAQNIDPKQLNDYLTRLCK